jgi:hypothetical protein
MSENVWQNAIPFDSILIKGEIRPLMWPVPAMRCRKAGEIGQTSPVSHHVPRAAADLFTFLQPFAQNTQICAWRILQQLLGLSNLSDSVPAHASYPSYRAAVLCDCAPTMPLS